ncbi:MAG: DNA repair protein RadA, partial [Rhodospirillaceae bacterium]|nr:DNA repair protein RadA [Rhodospirillaceae bacterium]
GEIRTVSQMDNRLKEAAKLGFERAIVPKRRARADDNNGAQAGLQQKSIGHLGELLALFESPAEASGSRGRG